VLKIAIQYLLAYVFIFSSVLASAATAQPSAPVNIRILSSFEAAPYQITLHSIVDYLQSQTSPISITSYTLLDNKSSSNEIIEKINQGDSELIITLGDDATRIARQSFPNKTIVASLITQPEDFKHRNNMIGIQLSYPIDKHFQWIKKILPQAKHIGVLYNPAENKNKIKMAKQSAKKFGFSLHEIKVSHPRELPKALEEVFSSTDVLWTIPDKIALSRRSSKAILLASFRNKIPIIGPSTTWVKAGALYALEWDYINIGIQSAKLALSVLADKNYKPTGLTETNHISYALNMRIAKLMKISISNEVKNNANIIIQ